MMMVNLFYYGNAWSNKKTRTDKFGGRFSLLTLQLFGSISAFFPYVALQLVD